MFHSHSTLSTLRFLVISIFRLLPEESCGMIEGLGGREKERNVEEREGRKDSVKNRNEAEIEAVENNGIEF